MNGEISFSCLQNEAASSNSWDVFLSVCRSGTPLDILITFSPEFAEHLKISGAISAGRRGDVQLYRLSCRRSGQWIDQPDHWITKKNCSCFYFINTACSFSFFFSFPLKRRDSFISRASCLGLESGIGRLFVTIAAEQFGTNLRSTVATTVPNFIRGTVVPLTLAFKFLRGEVGIIQGALIIGVTTIIIAFIALSVIDETFGRDLNFEEID